MKKLLSQGFLVFFKGFDNFADRKEEVKDYFGRSADGMYQCKACGKKEKHNSNLKSHVEAHHYSPGYSCQICGRNFQLYKACKRHEKNYCKGPEVQYNHQ